MGICLGLKMSLPKGLSWLAEGGAPLTKEVLESLGFTAHQYSYVA